MARLPDSHFGPFERSRVATDCRASDERGKKLIKNFGNQKT